MRSNNQYNIELLINYYQNVIALNDAFSDLDNRNENNRYKHLVSQLVVIRQSIIDKSLANINTLYKPIRELFINQEHFSTLEEIIAFYKNNPDANYDIVGAEQYLNNHLASSVPVDLTDMQKVVKYIEQSIVAPINIALAKVSDDFNAKLTGINNQISQITNDSISELIAKSSNDILASLSTSRELMKSDIAKYDALLTEHITKSGINIAEAIEKEHARFAQKIASDSNAIIAGISEAVSGELATQTDLIKDSMKKLDDKAFKRASFMFIGCVCALFACSLFSSTWAASKVISNLKILAATSK